MTADEAAHFVTSAMIHDFLKSHDLIHPIQFAQAYYKHFPRVAIGHWPPFFHTAQALFFFVVGPSVGGSMVFQALIAGLAAGIPAAIAHHRWGRVAGTATGLLVLLSPNFLFLVNAVMIDNFSGLMVLLAALTWGRYWQARSWRSGLVFAATAIGATMTKGNALGLALLPIIHAVLSREVGPFRLLKTWIIAALIGAVIVPWYLLTYKLTSDGFIYHFGWDFSSHALPTYLRYFAQLVGLPALAGLALVWSSIGIQVYRSRDVTITALLAAVLAIFLFQVIAPADVQPRYLISALPAAAPLAVGGIGMMGRKLVDQLRRSAVLGDGDQGRSLGAIGRPLLSNAFLTLGILVSIGSVFRVPRTRSFQMDKIAATVVAAKAVNPLVLVCTTPNAEGAAIAAFTALERQPYHYVVRGTQALSSSRFLGNDYKTRFRSPTELKRWLVEHKIGWLVIDTSSESRSWAHNEVAVALSRDQAGWRQVSEYRRGDGAIRLYALPDQHVFPTNLERTLSTTRPSALAQF